MPVIPVPSPIRLKARGWLCTGRRAPQLLLQVLFGHPEEDSAMFRIFRHFGSIRQRRADVPPTRRPPCRPRVEALEERCAPAAGFPDPAFGAGGKVTVPFNGTVKAAAVAIDAQGRIVVAGSTADQGGRVFAVARLRADGSPDPTFGTAGKTTVSFNANDEATAVAIDAQGRIVVAGNTAVSIGPNDFAAARLNPDGSLDKSFGIGGKSVAYFNGDDKATAVAIDAQGRVVVAGTTDQGGGNLDFAVTRLQVNGYYDLSFGSLGKTTVSFNADDKAAALAIDAQGRIVVAGATAVAGGFDFAVARLTAGGLLDAAFGTGGKTTASFNARDDASAVAIDAQGRVVVAGTTDQGGGNYDFAVTRLTTGGLSDDSFGTGAKTTVSFNAIDQAAAVAIDAQGRIVVAGTTGLGGGNYDFAVARLTAGGSLDPAFGAGGTTTASFNADDKATAVAIDGQGHVVIVGTTTLPGGGLDSEFAVVRLIGSPRPWVVSLVSVRRGRRRRLRVVVRDADTGEVKVQFFSPFHKPAYRGITALAVDTDGDGESDAVRITARRVGPRRKRVTRIIPV